MAVVNLLLQCIVVAVAFLSVVFVIASSYRRRYDLIDTAWGLTFMVVALYAFFAGSPQSVVGAIVLAMVSIWGLRLSWHIFRRWRRSDEEDPRYIALRENWPKKARVLQMYVRVYLAQAILACVVSLPVIVLMHDQPAVSLLTIIGVVVWAIGFICESLADRQLKQFLQTNTSKDALLTTGLWKYSRHPNYFGEVTQWWGIAIITLASHYGWVGTLGALTITILICFVSGIPPAERRAAAKPGWKAYKKATSPLIPLPPRS